MISKSIRCAESYEKEKFLLKAPETLIRQIICRVNFTHCTNFSRKKFSSPTPEIIENSIGQFVKSVLARSYR